MPKKFFKRLMPDHHKIRTHKSLQVFGTLLHDPNLWHLNRRSVAGSFGIGLFVAFLPLPMHMLIAAALAIPLRANLPLAVGVVWVNNPFTLVPMYYFAYRFGAWLIGTAPDPHATSMHHGAHWLLTQGWDILQPLFLGGVVAGLACGLFGYFGIRVLWRWQVVQRWRARQTRSSM